MEGVEIHILGQTYVVKGGESPEHIRELAAHVDARIKEVYAHIPGTPPLRAVILAALNIADELLKEKDERSRIVQALREVEEKTDTIIGLFE